MHADELGFQPRGPRVHDRERARRRGDLPTSPEFMGAIVAVVALVALQQQGGAIFNGLLAQNWIVRHRPR